MKTAKTIPLLLVLASLAGAAVASHRHESDDCRAPMSEWRPRSEVQAHAEAQGWQVRRIKIEDGCYEIVGRDQNGRAIEVHIDPASFEIIKIEYEDDNHEDHHEERQNN
ncbi:MAG: PepSY domain-containing protein [Maritimibacter sp.]